MAFVIWGLWEHHVTTICMKGRKKRGEKLILEIDRELTLNKSLLRFIPQRTWVRTTSITAPKYKWTEQESKWVETPLSIVFQNSAGDSTRPDKTYWCWADWWTGEAKSVS
jgi:hypothetical protein